MNKKISPLEAYKISAVLEDVSYKIILSTKRSLLYSLPKSCNSWTF